MRETIHINIVGKETLDFKVPVSIWQIAQKLGKPYNTDVLAAIVNNELVDINYVIPCDAEVELIVPGMYHAFNIYRMTAKFILGKALADLKLNAKINIGQTIENGVYYDFQADRPLDHELLEKIEDRMNEIISEDSPIVHTRINFKSLMEYYKKIGLPSRANVVAALNRGIIEVYRLDKFIDIYQGPLAPSTGHIKKFALIMYGPGFVMRYPLFPDLNNLPPMKHQTKLFENYLETKEWQSILGVENVGALNAKSDNKRDISDLIKISEGLHEKKIAAIADQISRNRDHLKIILIAGPSSSGKTTFAKRLGIQLMVNGLTPVSLGLDDYFVDRENTPRDKNGDYDFETIKALDLPCLNEHLKKLLAGEKVEIPRFDFATGQRKKETHPMQLKPGQILVIEGIHGLNDLLTTGIASENKFKIFISALTQLRIDGMTRISTSDTRLLRRMVRDFNYRGYSPVETIARWPSVRRGEERNIFPFQNNADVMFNSALVYEMAVIKPFALACLERVTPAHKELIVAQRLINFLNLFRSVNIDEIPPTSLMREFLGGSSFSY